MVTVITSLSRVTIIAFITIFALIDLVLIFEAKLSDEVKSILNTILSVMTVLFLLNSSIVLYLNTANKKIISLLVLELVLFAIIAIVANKIMHLSSAGLLNNMLLLLSFSFVFLERLDMDKAVRQLCFTTVSIIVSAIVIFILKKINNESRGYWYLYSGIGIVLLSIVLFAGSVEYGAKLSISFGNISIQPSEFVKLTFLYFMAACIAKYKDIRGFLLTSFIAAVHVLILVFSRDLGVALIFLITYVFVIFIAYKNYIVLTIEVVAAVVGGSIAYNMFPHIQSRFLAWTDPLSVVENEGYQISQSLFAIGAGGWIGSGIGKGMPNKIPVVSKDFIFSAICEEMGGIVAIALIVIIICTFFSIFNVAYRCDSFYMLIDSGFASAIAIQSLLNIGGVTKVIPSTGVTLPLVSYGGSSLLATIVGIFIVEASVDLSKFDLAQGDKNEKNKRNPRKEKTKFNERDSKYKVEVDDL